MKATFQDKNDSPLNGSISRRHFIAGAGTAALGLGLGPFGRIGQAAEQPALTEGFRFVFMPCIHLRRELDSPKGFAAALQAVEKLEPRPAFIFTGGDLCHDLRSQKLEPATEMAELFGKILKENTRLPAYHCLGNHDLAGWNDNHIPTEHPLSGKKLLIEKLGMPGRYHSFDREGWHFVALDNIHAPAPGKWLSAFGEEQIEWLRADLRKNKERPTILAMHVPALTAIELLYDRTKKSEGEISLPFGRMSRDTTAFLAAAREGNVRAILSGHLHLEEDLELAGFRFLCCGSVSAHQWTGPRLGKGSQEGFGVFDCRPDGTFAYRYHDYRWKAQETEKTGNERKAGA